PLNTPPPNHPLRTATESFTSEKSDAGWPTEWGFVGVDRKAKCFKSFELNSVFLVSFFFSPWTSAWMLSQSVWNQSPCEYDCGLQKSIDHNLWYRCCCVSLDTTQVPRIPIDRVLSHFNRRFTSKIGQKVRRICADPNGKWTRRAIKKVNEDRLRALQENEDNAGVANRASTESPTSSEGSSRPRRNNNKGRRNSRNRRRVSLLYVFLVNKQNKRKS
uniref:C-C motif chemokine 4-like n=1 Tax=Gadus morhua TaxID=8049 RepID=A0A8C5AZC4_GADMO